MGKGIESFQARLIRHLLKVLDGRSDPFISILAKARNCDPAFLVDTLCEMEARRLVHAAGEGPEREYVLTPRAKALSRGCHRWPASMQVENSERANPSLLESHYFTDLVNAVRNSLPEPCLVYSQWWFSEPTYARLVDLLLRFTRKNAHVAFVGASTLAAVFSQCTISPTTIIDIDEVLLKKIATCAAQAAQLMCRDISCPLDTSLKGKFDLVVSDPPWSRSSLRTFFLRSAELLAPAGTLVISFPPVFTRPSVQVERRGLLRTAERIGLSLANNLPDFTEYSVPLFERRAYEAHAIELNHPWRRGDIFVFKKSRRSIEFDDIPIEPAWRWDQYDYGMARLFLKKNGSAEDGPARIVPISGSDRFTYDSTSSRTRIWKHASLVSTRNQIADVSGTKQLAIIFQELLGRTADLSDGIRSLSSVRPDTRVALSVLVSGPDGKDAK